MDATEFSEFKTGRLVPITFFGKDDHAFIPNPLPPRSVGHEALWELLIEARTKIERLSAIGSQLPDVNLLLRPLQRREALTSNSLEGTFVTPQELLLFEVAQRGARDQPMRDDWREVVAYDHALRHGCRLIEEGREIDGELMRTLHLLLLSMSTRGRDKTPGQFRKSQVVVGSDRRYIPPPPDELDSALANLETYLTTALRSDVDPLLAAFIAHYQFEAIHPFQDGNGRIGRVILSLCIYKWLDLSTPCLYMSEYFDRHRREYISHLYRISTHGEWHDWLRFCLTGTIEQAVASIGRCEALQQLKRRYKTLLAGDRRAALLVDDLFASPFMTVADAQSKLKVTYRTAKSCLLRLAAAGIVTEVEHQYPLTFVAREIFDAAYED